MFKTYCGGCGNSWYIGNPRTCTCSWKDALKREWVGLTIENKKEYIAQDFGGSLTDAMDWIEKRLMEKNNGT